MYKVNYVLFFLKLLVIEWSVCWIILINVVVYSQVVDLVDIIVIFCKHFANQCVSHHEIKNLWCWELMNAPNLALGRYISVFSKTTNAVACFIFVSDFIWSWAYTQVGEF